MNTARNLDEAALSDSAQLPGERSETEHEGETAPGRRLRPRLFADRTVALFDRMGVDARRPRSVEGFGPLRSRLDGSGMLSQRTCSSTSMEAKA